MFPSQTGMTGAGPASPMQRNLSSKISFVAVMLKFQDDFHEISKVKYLAKT